ncbi:hypothetical protein [Rhodococcus sp. ABRD24]|uniref:hypothetical protein n=1 Tax=Rhodococcus sp. ABRD24 TaxID=2507582 RepID=UPI001F607342|nr:hypothetical protein [Rhodococcus sp. ABRD24]
MFERGRAVEQEAFDVFEFVVGDVRQRLGQCIRFREVDPPRLERGTNLMQMPPQIAAQSDHAPRRGLGETEDAGELAVACLVASRARIFLAAHDEQCGHRVDLAELFTGDAGVLLGEHGGHISVHHHAIHHHAIHHRAVHHPGIEHVFDHSGTCRHFQASTLISIYCRFGLD